MDPDNTPWQLDVGLDDLHDGSEWRVDCAYCGCYISGDKKSELVGHSMCMECGVIMWEEVGNVD